MSLFVEGYMLDMIKKGNITEYVFATAGTYMERSKREKKVL